VIIVCGIAGQYCFKSEPDKNLVIRMSKILEHRGPDAEGTHFNKVIGLAHRRLSIIDLSKSADQPMYNEREDIVIVYNGELYNYLSLKSILLGYGHTFKTNSDTEVIIHAYEQWGINCLVKFHGMFAFAIWDDRKQVLFCARDRFGIKPLYYTFIGDSLLFASEIKALLADPNVGISPNNLELNIFLSSGILDHSNKTMFKNIYQIQPSCAFVANNFEIKHFKYCDLDISSKITSAVPDSDIAANINYLLNNSVKSHLQSDVPVGTCLSGGIDSTAIARIINLNHNMQNTFSAYFSDKRFSELNYIMAATENTTMHPFLIKPDPSELLKDLDSLIYYQDEPFGSLSIYAQYCVMKLAHGKVKVLLDGQGADELFGGYIAYQSNYIKEPIYKKKYIMALKELYGSLKHHLPFYKYAINQVITRNKRKDLLTSYQKIDRYKGKFNDMLYNELFVTNLPSLLHYEDRNSMKFSIEARVPYLDVDFSSYIASLPYNQKIRNGVTKFALRNAIKGIIPEIIRNRMDKMGFVTPEEEWMKYELSQFMFDILYSTSFKNRPYWNSDKVLKDYQEFVEGKTAYSNDIWRIVCTELWLRKFFDNRSTLFSGIL